MLRHKVAGKTGATIVTSWKIPPRRRESSVTSRYIKSKVFTTNYVDCQLQHPVCHDTSSGTVAPALRSWLFCPSSHKSSNSLRTATLHRIVRSGGLRASTARLVARMSCSASCGCSCNAIIVHKSLKVNLAVEAQEHSITVNIAWCVRSRVRNVSCRVRTAYSVCIIPYLPRLARFRCEARRGLNFGRRM